MSVTSPPFVSVVVPVYNGEKYLNQCLSAIEGSPYPSYELIIVDNGSTDNSLAIAQRHRGLVLSCPGPSGPAAARNYGAGRAKGEVLFFVDADVVVHADTLSRVVDDFKENPSISAVFGSYDDSPTAPNFISQYKNLLHHFVHQHSSTEATTFWAGCGAIRREVFQKLGGFDQQRYPKPSIEDIELGHRLRRMGYRILLDKDLQAKHLKEWRLASLLRADILYRAVPWSRLMLEGRGLVNDLNLQTSQRVSAGLVAVMFLLLPFAFAEPLTLLGLVPLSLAVLILNRRLFAFLVRCKGWAFAVLAFPMHLLYFFYSGATFVLCWSIYRSSGKR